jgi:hypothetical protein
MTLAYEEMSNLPEVLEVGRLRLHPIPFDHAYGSKELPDAPAAYNAMQTIYPDIVTIMEYFVPEILNEPGAGLVTASGHGEIENIKASYGPFVDEAGINRVVVIDPAYNMAFGVPMAAAVATGFGLVRTGLHIALSSLDKNVDKQHDQRTDNHQLSRRSFLKLATAAIAIWGGGTTLVSGVMQTQTGLPESAGINPPDIPGTVFSETDFRILSAVTGLRQLGEGDPSDVQHATIVYPPDHLERIRKELRNSGLQQTAAALKLEGYEEVCDLLHVARIRLWQ